MRRAGGLAFALVLTVTCLVFVSMAGAALHDQVGIIQIDGENISMPVAPPDEDSTERLMIADPERSDHAEASLDPTVSTSVSFAKLEGRHNEIRVRMDMDAADGSLAEVAVVEEELERIEAQIVDDLVLKQAVRRAFVTGDIDGDEFLRELSMIHLRSTVIEEELDALSQALRTVAAPVTRDEAQQLRGAVSQAQLEARTLQGPVTERTAGALTAERSIDGVVLIEASENGYTLATIDDGMYVREAVASENRLRGSGSGFRDIDGARSLVAELYPWTVAESLESEDIPRGEIYSTTIDHTHGTTAIYIDAETERPFRDGHELDLFSIPTVQDIEETHGDVRVVIQRSYAGGPAQVGILSAADGAGISSVQVRIDDRTVGTTGGGGSVWFVAPDATFEMTLVMEDETVTVPIELPG